MKLNKLIALCSLVLILPITSTFAKTPEKISCGPYMDTYKPVSLSGEEGHGIRCVQFTDTANLKSKNNKGVIFAWYGEGIWGTNRTYRHLGHAFKTNNQGELKGYASDIWGNGEYADGNFPGNLNIKIVDKDTIRVTGAWYEEWKKVTDVNDWQWMKTPITCGDYMDSDKTIHGSRVSGTKLICTLKIGQGKLGTTSVGFATLNGKSVSILITKNSKGQTGASSFCKKAETCNNFSFGEYIKP